MALDQMFFIDDEDGVELTIVPVDLNLDKEIYLLHVFENNKDLNKKFIRAELVLVGMHILTTRFSDTIHFFEELKLFDYGNNQNKYLDITEYKATKNLKLKYHGDNDVFIAKSEALAIKKKYDLAFHGYSTVRLLENEYIFTAQTLTKLLHQQNFLTK